MIGLNLVSLKAKPSDPSIYNINFETVDNIKLVEGLTKLANSFIFNLLSSYSSLTKVGSDFKLYVAAPLLYEQDFQLASVQLAEELKKVEKRFLEAQNKPTLDIPKKERLLKAVVKEINLDMSTREVTIRIELWNELGEKATIEI